MTVKEMNVRNQKNFQMNTFEEVVEKVTKKENVNAGNKVEKNNINLSEPPAKPEGDFQGEKPNIQ